MLIRDHHACRQYDAVNPANRPLAAELEPRWTDQLPEVGRQEEGVAAAERKRLLALPGASTDDAYSRSRPAIAF